MRPRASHPGSRVGVVCRNIGCVGTSCGVVDAAPRIGEDSCFTTRYSETDSGDPGVDILGGEGWPTHAGHLSACCFRLSRSSICAGWCQVTSPSSSTRTLPQPGQRVTYSVHILIERSLSAEDRVTFKPSQDPFSVSEKQRSSRHERKPEVG